MFLKKFGDFYKVAAFFFKKIKSELFSLKLNFQSEPIVKCNFKERTQTHLCLTQLLAFAKGTDSTINGQIVRGTLKINLSQYEREVSKNCINFE